MIYNTAWLSDQTVATLTNEIDENPLPVVNLLIETVYDERIPLRIHNLAINTLKQLDVNAFSFELKNRITAVIRDLSLEDASEEEGMVNVLNLDDSIDNALSQLNNIVTRDLQNSVEDSSEETISDEESNDYLFGLERQVDEINRQYQEKKENDELDLQLKLIAAVKENKREVIDTILEKNISIETYDPETGYTPLIWAAELRNEELFEYLIKRDAIIRLDQESVGRMIDKWIREEKYDQLKDLLVRNLFLGEPFYDGKTFLEHILENGGDVAQLLMSLSLFWRKNQVSQFPFVPNSNYENILPGDFAIIFSIPEYRSKILKQQSFQFMNKINLICMSHFLSKQEDMKELIKFVMKLNFNQQQDYLEGVRSEAELKKIKKAYVSELGLSKTPRNLFEDRLVKLKKLVENLCHLNGLLDHFEKGDKSSAIMKNLPEIIENNQQTITTWMTKLPHYKKQGDYLAFWLESRSFSIKRNEFMELVKPLFSLSERLGKAKQKLMRDSGETEDEIYEYREKGEILSNSIQFNIKINTLNEFLKTALGCDQGFVYENNEPLYNFFYTSFEDHARTFKDKDEESAYAKVLEAHLQKVLEDKNIKTKDGLPIVH